MWQSSGVGLIAREMCYRQGCGKGYGKDYGMCYSWGSSGSVCGESGWSSIHNACSGLSRSVVTSAQSLFAGLSLSSLFAEYSEMVGAATCIALLSICQALLEGWE